jgi:tetratricopeptide (TPR) repeat protein
VTRALAEARGLFEARRYEEASKAARAVLDLAPDNAEAQALQKKVGDALQAIGESRRRAQSLFDSGNYQEATDALLALLKLAPGDPEGQKLATRLDRHARGQADETLARMKEARARAQQARPELAPDAFERARGLDGEGARLYQGRQYSQAAAKLAEAAEAYARAESEARAEGERQRAEAERRAAALRATPSPTEAPVDEAAVRQAEDARRAFEAARRGLPADPRAAAEDASAQEHLRQGRPAEAAAAWKRAAAPYEALRQDRQAIQAVIQRYKASMEGRDIDALKAVWPAVEEKKVHEGFQIVKSWRIDLQINDLQVAGDAATVTCDRRDDMMTVDGARVPRASVARFSLRKRAGSWIIEGIQ